MCGFKFSKKTTKISIVVLFTDILQCVCGHACVWRGESEPIQRYASIERNFVIRRVPRIWKSLETGRVMFTFSLRIFLNAFLYICYFWTIRKTLWKLNIIPSACYCIHDQCLGQSVNVSRSDEIIYYYFLTILVTAGCDCVLFKKKWSIFDIILLPFLSYLQSRTFE